MNALWTLAVFLPLMALACGLLVPLRKAVGAWASQYTDTPAEAELSAAEALKAQLDQQVRQGALAEELEARQAQLKLEAAQLETDAEAARQCLPQAVEARQVALEARGRAEAQAAPELARRNADAEVLQVLKDAYAVFCREYGWSDVPTFATWISGFSYENFKQGR